MNYKYRVIAVAYKDIDTDIEYKITQNSVKTLTSYNYLDETYPYSSKGFNLNDRLFIYLDWFKKDIQTKIKEGYSISILEMPIKSSDDKLASLKESHLVYGDNLLIIDSVAV
jgi:hypothetical protein